MMPSEMQRQADGDHPVDDDVELRQARQRVEPLRHRIPGGSRVGVSRAYRAAGRPRRRGRLLAGRSGLRRGRFAARRLEARSA